MDALERLALDETRRIRNTLEYQAAQEALRDPLRPFIQQAMKRHRSPWRRLLRKLKTLFWKKTERIENV